jgi:hypothetical protein
MIKARAFVTMTKSTVDWKTMHQAYGSSHQLASWNGSNKCFHNVLKHFLATGNDSSSDLKTRMTEAIDKSPLGSRTNTSV